MSQGVQSVARTEIRGKDRQRIILLDDGGDVEGQDAAGIRDLAHVHVQDDAVVLAYACEHPRDDQHTTPRLHETHADSHAMVVVDTTWLFRNFCRLFTFTSTP